jgi:hypothetical protein
LFICSVEFPKELLKLKSFAREMTFYSTEELHDFKLVQTICLHGQVVEGETNKNT